MALKLPDAKTVIQGAIAKALRESAPIVKNKVVGNVNRLLNRTGRLASSVYSRVRMRKGGGTLTVGTAVVYGRFWEYGFLRGAKSVSGLVRGKARRHRSRSAGTQARLIEGGAKFYRRPWFRPPVEEAAPEVIRRVETELNNALKQYSGSTTIDIKITF